VHYLLGACLRSLDYRLEDGSWDCVPWIEYWGGGIEVGLAFLGFKTGGTDRIRPPVA
jgi:hypothetical protein